MILISSLNGILENIICLWSTRLEKLDLRSPSFLGSLTHSTALVSTEDVTRLQFPHFPSLAFFLLIIFRGKPGLLIREELRRIKQAGTKDRYLVAVGEVPESRAVAGVLAQDAPADEEEQGQRVEKDEKAFIK
jgi:hypothetical protein